MADCLDVLNAYPTLKAIAEAIREFKEIPSGHLYAHLMGKFSLDTYNGILDLFKKLGLIKVEYHLITWIKD